MTTATATLTLTGITKARSECHCCGRTLGKVFQLSDGNDYGRVCAAKLTGFKVTDQSVRAAEMLRRNNIAAAELSALSTRFAGVWANIEEASDNEKVAAMEAVIAVRDGWQTATEALELFDRMSNR